MSRHLAPDTIQAYLDHELDPSTREAFELHLRQCPACRTDVALLEKLGLVLATEPTQAPPRGFTRTTMARLGLSPAVIGPAAMGPFVRAQAWILPLAAGLAFGTTLATAVFLRPGWLLVNLKLLTSSLGSLGRDLSENLLDLVSIPARNADRIAAGASWRVAHIPLGLISLIMLATFVCLLIYGAASLLYNALAEET